MVAGHEEETRSMLRSLLELWGYEVVESTGSQPFIRSEERTPDLVLLDSQIPFSASLDEIREIKQSLATKDVPVVLISGFCQPEFRNAALSAGAADLLVKPVDFDALETYMDQMTSEHNDRPGGLT